MFGPRVAGGHRVLHGTDATRVLHGTEAVATFTERKPLRFSTMIVRIFT
ncbi:MAG: hypothetical protein IPN95_25170 [Bacteroidetes bacterium]|nr:hypothetical protein [Bacteroidota bacterium]